MFSKRVSSAAVVVEACGCLLLAGCVLKFVEFKHIAAWLNMGTGFLRDARNDELDQIRLHIKVVAKRLPYTPKCFERAIAAKVMLRRRKIQAKLYLGVKREGDKFVAHAWLEHEEARDYVQLACF